MRAAMATDSPELAQIATEAQDIAKNVGQPAGTAHLLLATFTIPNAADVLLRERGCDEDKVLAELSASGLQESPELFAQALEKARQLANDCGSVQAEALHLLVALTRLSKSAASVLLEKTAAPVASLRTTALGYLTGAVPRRREAPAPAPVPKAAVVVRPQPARVTTIPPEPSTSTSTSPSTSTTTSTSTSTSTSTLDPKV